MQVAATHPVADPTQRNAAEIQANASKPADAPARAAIAASFDFMVAEPGAARLLTLKAGATEATVARQVVDSDAFLATLLRDGRRHTPRGPGLPDVTEEALIGALSAIVAGRLLDSGAARLTDLQPELVQFVLTPYVGVGVAARLAAAPGRPGQES
jgi:hypothetical protein